MSGMAERSAGREGDGRARPRTPPILRPRVHAVLVGAAAVSWVVLTVLSLLPGSSRPHTGYSGNLEHLVAYALSAGATRLCPFGVPSRMQLLGYSLASALFEVAQIWIPGRLAGVDNWIASTAGALAGILAARLYAHRSIITRRRA